MKIKDNSSLTMFECSDILGIVEKISNKTLERLEKEGIFVFPNILRDSEDITKEQFVLQTVNDTIKTGNVMGFLGLGSERLVIESRFSNNENDFFFQYLLEKVLDFPNIINLKTDSNKDEQIISLLIFMFPNYLKNAIRKGLFKTYIRNEYNDENVKGTIDVDRHIRENTPFIGKIAYSQREYAYDNYLTELIRHTIEYIKGKSYGNRILETVKDEIKIIVEKTDSFRVADRRKIIEANKKQIVRHAYYNEYKDLQNLCILILQNEKHQIGVGSKKVFGILFDGAWLWEEYVNNLVKNSFYHPMNKSGKGSQWLFAGNVGLIYPDFICKNKKIIADAKYKPSYNIGNKDYLQILAYMFRFEASLAYYFYPETDELAEDIVLMLNQGSSYENNVVARDNISVIKHGLLIPSNVDSYKEFKLKIQQFERDFIENIG